MSGAAPAETERPIRVEEPRGEVVLPTTPEKIHEDTVQATTNSVVEAGHPTTAEQVSAQGEANAVLARIENAGIGVQAVELSGDVLTKGLENLGGDVQGSKRDYSVKGLVGHRIKMQQMAKKVLSTGIAERIEHYLSKFRRKK